MTALWKRWWTTAKLDLATDLPQFAAIYPEASRGEVPWDALRCTAFVVRKEHIYVGYKLFRDTNDDVIAWKFWWTDTTERKQIQAIIRLIEAHPIALHTIFETRLPRLGDDLAKFTFQAERAPRRDAPPPGDMGEVIFYELNHEYQHVTPAWCHFQLDHQLFGPGRVQRMVNGACAKLATQLHGVAYQIDLDPKELYVWCMVGAPHVPDDLAFRSVSNIALHPRVSRALREQVTVKRLEEFEANWVVPRHWTVDDALSYAIRIVGT